MVYLQYLSLNLELHKYVNFYFQEIDQENGLSELTTSYLSKDSKGFIWIGTRDGLNRFDGKKIKVFRPVSDNNNFDPNLSSKVFEDKQGLMWFTTSKHIYYFDARP